MINYSFLSFENIGKFLLCSKAGKLTGLYKEGGKYFPKITKDWIRAAELPIFKKTALQLKEFLLGERRSFDLEYFLEGADFQKKVWKALARITYGQTSSYKNLAELVFEPKSYRAVAGSIARNPILIILPCHRIIGSDSSLKGFSAGIELKKYLLALENSNNAKLLN